MSSSTEFFISDVLAPRSLNNPRFYNALRNSSALISGGSILYAILKSFNLKSFSEKYWKNTDLDIYVNAENAKSIKDYLCSISSGKAGTGLETETIKPYYQINKNTTFYCNSFLKKNRIIRVLRFPGLNLDLMIVRNTRKLQDVIYNFDLDCCMNYFDACEWKITSRYLNDKKDLIFVNNRIDTNLTPTYAVEFYRGNSFILKRFSKYSLRGFHIRIPPLTSEVEEQIVPHKVEPEPYMYINTLLFTAIFRSEDHRDLLIEDFKTYLQKNLRNSTEFRYGTNGQYRTDYILLDDEEFRSRQDYQKIGYEKLHDFAFKILENFILENCYIESDLREKMYNEYTFYRNFKFSGS